MLHRPVNRRGRFQDAKLLSKLLPLGRCQLFHLFEQPLKFLCVHNAPLDLFKDAVTGSC